MITGKINRKHQQSINHANVKTNLMIKNIIQIKSEIIIDLDVSLKNIIYVKKNYTWNPAICSFENGNYLANILDDSFLTCDEIILFHSEVRT